MPATAPQVREVGMNAEAHCMSLASTGAILTVAGKPDQHFLVGYFEWIGSNRIFWFNANGSDAHDANILEFDRATAAPAEIGFVRAGKLVAVLSGIETAPVADRDDYRIAWQIWQQIAPMQQAKIKSLRALHDLAVSG